MVMIMDTIHEMKQMKLTIFALRRARTALAESSAREAVDVACLIDEKIQSLTYEIEQGTEVIS